MEMFNGEWIIIKWSSEVSFKKAIIKSGYLNT